MRYNVLIVDDDKLMADSMADLIATLGHNPIAVYGPRSAMDILKEAVPEIIFLDVNMAGVDGLEVCRYIRRDPFTADIPIVVVSANDSQADIAAAYRAGANEYIVKPASIDAVEAAIARLLKNDRA
ncbi:MAG: response regulator [Anaerolineae bacterium]|nr:response regulator [Anaerolineae bacterium]